MAKVILQQSLASPDTSWASGDEYECADDEAARLVEAGIARLPDPPARRAPARETADAAMAPEKAAR